MEIRDLKALRAVIDCGSFSEAAALLGYTQSAISQQIAALESELGQQLVSRRPVRPTEAGARLAEHAAHLLLRVDVAISELSHLNRASTHLRFSISPLADRAAVGASIQAIQSFDPTIRLTVSSLSPHAAVNAIARGEVDVALVDGLAVPDEPLHLSDAGLLSSSFVVGRPVVIVLAAVHPLSTRRSINLDTLTDAPWIATPQLVDHAPLLRLGLTATASPAAVYDGSDVRTLLSMVAAGLGVALLPWQPDIGGSGVAAVPVSAPTLTHRSELVALRNTAADPDGLIQRLRKVH